jgi:hypothetical protein
MVFTRELAVCTVVGSLCGAHVIENTTRNPFYRPSKLQRTWTIGQDSSTALERPNKGVKHTLPEALTTSCYVL